MLNLIICLEIHLRTLRIAITVFQFLSELTRLIHYVTDGNTYAIQFKFFRLLSI